jgi:hypothetical protein
MLSKQDVLRLLTGPAQILWKKDTSHEAILLLEATFRRHEDLREQLANHVLAGPQKTNLENRHDDRSDDDFRILEILSYLVRCNLPLPDRANRILETAREARPTLFDEPLERVGMRYWIESSTKERPRQFSIQDIQQSDPARVVAELVRYKGEFGKSKRDFAEAVGVACAKDLSWGVKAWTAATTQIEDLEAESTIPWFWGFSAGLGSRDEAGAAQLADTNAIVDLWQQLIREKPDPSFWYSIPRSLIDLCKTTGLPKNQTDALVTDLVRLFLDFDFEKQTNEVQKPVEWLNRAINHPLGSLFDWQLDLAQKEIGEDVRAGHPWQLRDHYVALFDAVVLSSGKGARYGLCLMARRLAWIEAVLPKWAEDKMFPMFSWTVHPERAVVAWSGYLWGRGLSHLMKDKFEATYGTAALHIALLGKEERKGLMAHVGGICWFERGFVEQLKEIATAVETDDRAHLLDVWENHIASASKEDAEAFMQGVVFHYWDWCRKQAFFVTPVADKERRGFWDLVPYAGSQFPGACKRAKLAPPSRSDGSYLLLKAMGSERAWESPSDAVDFAICVLQTTEHPQWEADNWNAIWQMALKGKASNIERFRDELAKSGLSFQSPQTE